jgi:NAD(P)-dependent dehydrogenase (short-subunit alcohol dehydrogenase family)
VLKQINDICSEESCTRLVEAAAKEFGRIDALINNAVDHGYFDRVETADLDLWHEQFDTNVLGTLRLSRAAVLQMKTQPEGGSIVMINTMGAKMVPIVAEVGYCTSKAALLHATKALAMEVGPYGVRVNSLHPGWMWGAPVQGFLAEQTSAWGTLEEAYDRIAGELPLRRVPTDDECARAALFLASDYSSAITGASLDANGGNYMP